MKILGTLPSPHRDKLLLTVARHPRIDELRFNTGMRVHLSPMETLKVYLDACDGKKFWIDLKGRQLRITQWAVPNFGDIVLNHEIEVRLPTEIYFRGAEKSVIRKINKNKIFIDPPPPKAVGAGQAVNVPNDSLLISGYFTEEDLQYIDAAKGLGLKNFMLSFVEEQADIQGLLDIIPNANIIAKIESKKGLEFIESIQETRQNKFNLMAARDDLFINIGEDKTNIFKALITILKKDSSAIVASRLFTSLEENKEISLSDLSDFLLMKEYGYKNFLLSDSLCSDEKQFLKAMTVLKNFEIAKA